MDVKRWVVDHVALLRVLLALLLLIHLTRTGPGWPVVVVALVVYVVAVTLWVRDQHAAWREHAPLQTLPVGVLAAVAVGGVVVAAAGAWLAVRGLLGSGLLVSLVEYAAVLAAAVFYLAAGYLTDHLRRPEGSRRRALLWGGTVLLLVVLGGVGLPLTPWAAAPLVVGLLLVPPWATVLATVASARLTWPRSRLRVAGSGGLVLLALVAWGVWGAVSGPLAAFLVVLLLLAVAIVSATKADTAVVLGAVALLSVTPVQESAPRPPADADVPSLFILGDSYMSGEGASVYYAGTDDAGVNGCRRAPRTWAETLGRSERRFRGHTFDLACSGASTRNIRLRPSGGLPDPETQYADEGGTQLQQVLSLPAARGGAMPGRHTVLLSVGGNDAGFSTVGTMCLAPGSCADESERWLDDRVFDRVEQALDATYADVRRTFPDADVLVTPYPDPILARTRAEDGADERCDQVALTKDEGDFVRAFLGRLNASVAAAATRHGFQVIDTMPQALATAGLQLCDPRNDGRPGVNFIRIRSVNGLAQQRMNPANWLHNSLHPNERGHAAMFAAYLDWAAEDRVAQQSGEPQRGVVGTGEPCDVLDLEQGCRSTGEAWIREQVARTLLWPGLAVLAYAALAWLAAVLLFAGLRGPERSSRRAPLRSPA